MQMANRRCSGGMRDCTSAAAVAGGLEEQVHCGLKLASGGGGGHLEATPGGSIGTVKGCPEGLYKPYRDRPYLITSLTTASRDQTSKSRRPVASAAE